MRTRILVVLTLALAATAGALYLTLTSDHEENAEFIAALYLVIVWSFIGTGLLAWARRPGEQVRAAHGHRRVRLHARGALGDQQRVPLRKSARSSADWDRHLRHALLAFPARLPRDEARLAIVGTAYFLVLGVQTLYNVFGASTCDGCPTTPLAIWDCADRPQRPWCIRGGAALAFVIGGTAWVLRRRWRAASPPLRRTLAPIFATSGADALLPRPGDRRLVRVLRSASDVIWWFVIVSFAAVPLAFLAGLLQIPSPGPRWRFRSRAPERDGSARAP
jgi:hypothetical protein